MCLPPVKLDSDCLVNRLSWKLKSVVMNLLNILALVVCLIGSLTCGCIKDKFCSAPDITSYSIESLWEHKGIKLVHVNVRSLLQHFDDIVVNLLDGTFDIVALTESWLHQNCSDNLIKVPGYKHYRLDRRVLNDNGTCKRGGGVIVYVRDTFSVTTHCLLDSSDHDLEAISPGTLL